ncbi:hypothetical protein [Candidatus Nitrosotalea okcheonensis]|uniref:3-keto-disaccharide hydrolase domain-containing protein n=1 Tax=Candidatus Nitrosotalea okcheonensis TaxID=1903276 RepID=A0A2H1FG63_9ARCH|nr:hypothetical protein [Candidatus Nitrosotalea okcheonensis]SMH71748.1 conserved exported protein of unknown function [Candidatus Nitrosotalea okcheonensis]
MSSQKPKSNKKKRLVIFAVITIIGISFAYYNAQINSGYHNVKMWNFDSYQNGTVPQGFAELSTDQQTSWIIKSEPSAISKPNVLEKLPINDTNEYHLQLIPDSPSVDAENVTMEFKIVSGENAKSAGMVLRFIDSKHYFVLMADSAQNRLSLCKNTPDFLICNYDKQVTIAPGEWHTMKALVSSQGIAAFLDGQLLIRANDHNYQSGEVGMWTKKDTGAFFDDFRIEY